jgi:hypothetical protein
MLARSLVARVVLVAAIAGCNGSTSVPSPDAPPPDPYAYMAPPASAPPDGLNPQTWQSHWTEDIGPYWTMAAAKGTPVGNFPTYRGMDGNPSGSAGRKPRMMGRQIFAYCTGYLLTGDESLLVLAQAGERWLLDHAEDKVHGGWYADLDADGSPSGNGAKFAQDMAYDAMGPAAYFVVTGDAEAEAAVLATRDLLFDPGTFWDAASGRIRDGMDAALTSEVWMESTGSSSLVAELDPVTAFLLVTQPVFTDPARRIQVLGDLRTLATLIKTSFWKDGFFWGSTGNLDQFGSNHSDFGHMLKTYWSLVQVDKRLPDHPFAAFLAENAARTLTMAWDADNGRWAKLPLSASAVRYGSDWWAYAEGDNLAATLALHDPSWIATLGSAAAHFRSDYVDRTRPAREVVSSIGRTGQWVYPWPDTDTSKCNEWKNGFHTSEHALVLSLVSSWVSGAPATLYFAFPAGEVAARAASSRPYTFLGRVAKVEDLGSLASDPARHKVRVTFDELR